ncbi:uncharacterized protein K02A2.6-like [Dermacentor silvarum]|uniref:uncharacterized protein K02A2.6-like n=1 Tax=Dermacentor silvarum TaxID=543639 RepID=UPI002101A253|nr:uncharacterized protein K02A2.6-like [Dermacentor silvarum]
MDVVKPPEPLHLSGNIRKNWLVFKQKLQLFITTTEPEKPRPSAVKAAILLSTAGDEALDVYNNFSFAAGENREDYDTLVRKFEEYCVDQGNEVYERHIFRLRTQEEAEPFERFLRDLKKQAKLCNFGSLEESMIRDQVVFGTNNAKLREKLLSDKDLNLQKAEEICKAAELSALQSAAWSKESLHVDFTNRTNRTKFANATRCRNCNKVHAPERCPAYGKTCYACKKRNHFAACCNNARRINEVHKLEEGDENFDILGISICGVTGAIGADWVVRGKIAGLEIQFKVDTGSQANLLPLSLFNRIANASTPRKSAAVLTAYNGSAIKHVGVATEDLEISETQHSVSFFIVKKGRQAILGLKACQQFGLIPVTADAVNVGYTRTEFQLAFPDLFSGTGCVERPYKMVLREDAVPVVQPARRVPIALKGRLRQELQRMEKASIIVKVDEPTDWFVPGKDLLLADMLSRAALPTGGSDQVEDVDVHTTQVVSSIISKATMVRLQKNTLEDPLLSRTMKEMEDGMAIDGVLKPYAEELSVVSGVILKGCKVVVPKSMRPEILERIHEGHLGMNKCKARARRLVFWPGMSSDIEQRARTCSVCRKYAYSQPSELLLLQPTPDRPWHRVGIDLFTFAGDHYVVVFDAHSNFPDVEKLRGTTAVEVIDKISAIFSRYGIPSQVCTDNGPQFASREFALFVHRYDFEHITSSPEFPRSNGLAEKGVQIVKRILKKTHESRGDVWLGLLAYRSSPLDSGQSPGELLQGRRLHATLPEYNVDGGIPVLKQRQSSRGRPLPPLEAGNVVRIKHRSWSRRAKVVKETAPRSYVVKTEDHGLLRRNRQHLLQTDENFDGEVSDVGNGNPHPDARHPDAPRRETECSDRHRGNITQGNPLGSHQAEPAHPGEDSNATSPETPGSPLAGLRRSGRQRSEPKRLHYGPSFHQVNECKSNQCFENV